MCLSQLLLNRLFVYISHDTKAVSDIAKSIDAGPVEIVNITRLGKKLDSRPRLMNYESSTQQS